MKKRWTTIFGLIVTSATGPLYAQDEIKANPGAGANKVAMCIGCHGITGYRASFPEVYKVPMISGQSARYIAVALDAYKKGDRKHPAMRGIADTLSEQDIADIAAYYAEHGTAGQVPEKPARQPGAQVEQLLQKGACTSCHGENFSKPLDPSYPKIAGQHADYLFAALKSYKNAKGTYVGRANGIMQGIAQQFTVTELKVLANYMASLDSELEVVPQSRFR